MVADFMAVDTFAAAAQVYVFTNTDVDPVGSDLDGVSETPYLDDITQECLRNRVIEFLGSSYALIANGVYRQTGADYGLIHSLVSPDSTYNTSCRIGPYVTWVNNQPELVVIYRSSDGNNTFRSAHTSNGTTWTTYGPFTVTSLGAFDALVQGDIIWNNIVYFCIRASSSRLLLRYNAQSKSLGSNSLTGTNLVSTGSAMELVVYRQRLILFCHRSNTSQMAIFDVTSGIPQFLASTGWTSNNTLGVGRNTAFVLDDTLYCLFFRRGDGAGNGWKLVKFDSAFAATDLTSTVIPAALQIGRSVTERFQAVVNQSAAVGGGPPEIWLLHTQNGTNLSDWTLYQWAGEGAEIGSGSIFTNTQAFAPWALSFVRNSGGGRFSSTFVGPNRGIITNKVELASHDQRFSFRLYGNGGSTATVRFLWGDADDAYCTNLCTISNPSTGSVVSNSINLTVDNGVTTYQITWNAVTVDGVSEQSRVRVVLTIG